jgi:hypothetical protein
MVMLCDFSLKLEISSEFILFLIRTVGILKILKMTLSYICFSLVTISYISVLIFVTHFHESCLYITNSNEFLDFI